MDHTVGGADESLDQQGRARDALHVPGTGLPRAARRRRDRPLGRRPGRGAGRRALPPGPRTRPTLEEAGSGGLREVASPQNS
ncbi:MAG: hypothetical protein AVDCRST_MAG32-2054 [uncultured Nocardioides sp.]|uniref:Uncharacterized protein n=1 Tax=uncultured Nocardioides sp. TaxID=198441 RepID=A0A6J4NGX2_9ACTN|nr:MAG: hypothetical protein AVDCRST_MAG32-2054 [uncultured Nocardioides sp.]